MKKFLLSFLALGCLLLTSCGAKMGNVTIRNDSSNLVVKEIVFTDNDHKSYSPRVYPVNLNPGEVWEKSIPTSSYTIVCEIDRDSQKYIGCSTVITSDDYCELKLSEMKTGYYKIVK